MTDTQGIRIRSWLDTCSGLRVGKDARGHLFVEVLRGRARRRARGHPRTGREPDLWPLGGRVRPGRLAAPASPPASWRIDGTVPYACA